MPGSTAEYISERSLRFFRRQIHCFQSQACWKNRYTLSKQCCGFGYGINIPDPIFFHPGSASKNLYDPGCSSRIPDPDFLPIPDPGVTKAPDPGSGSATLPTSNRYWLFGNEHYYCVQIYLRVRALAWSCCWCACALYCPS